MNTPLFIPKGINPDKAIFLAGHVPSSKNSKQIGFFYKKAGTSSSWYFKKGTEFKPITPTLRSSDQTEEYIKHIVQQIIDNKKRFKELVKDMPKPYIIQLHFVRKTKAMFDFGNAVEAIADSISGSFWRKHDKIPQIVTQWIDVDDMANVVFIPVLSNMLSGAPLYSVDKENPGVWIMPLDVRETIEKPLITKTLAEVENTLFFEPLVELIAPYQNKITDAHNSILNEILKEQSKKLCYNPNLKPDKCMCGNELTKNDGDFCNECKNAF